MSSGRHTATPNPFGTTTVPVQSRQVKFSISALARGNISAPADAGDGEEHTPKEVQMLLPNTKGSARSHAAAGEDQLEHRRWFGRL